MTPASHDPLQPWHALATDTAVAELQTDPVHGLAPEQAAMLALQLLFTYAPGMNRFFHSAQIPASAWLGIDGAGLCAHVLVGIEKWIRSRAQKKSADNHS